MQPCTTILSFLSLSKTEESLCKSPDDVLDAWEEYEWEYLEDNGFCGRCLEEARGLHRQAQQKFWDELPNLFDLPDWATLEQMRDTVTA
ncbi:BTB domain-containing protein [Mycena venus]|uniref:BTB domain-containing protein n=1 Tax=Mycena venus TaxID=2733690 RepID=A0A8H6YAF3_9AGAR|nr:BTB domain-containing protein [Mycena venus]